MLRPGTQDSYISRKVNLPTDKSHAELVRDVDPRIRAQAFFSARVAEAHILDRLREITDGYSRGDFGIGEARNKLKDFLRGEGYDPHQAGLRNLASTARLNLILKQNAAMAHSAAEWQRMHDPDAMKIFPYVRYHARNDRRTRSDHAHLDGQIFHKDDPFLKTHTPPWEFNCRCWLEEISEREAGKTPDLIQEPTPADKVTVDSKSGFQFDPAHAFEKFDLTSIKNEARREDVAEQLVNRFGMSISPDGKYASLPTDTVKIEMPPTKVGEKVNDAISSLKESKHIGTVNFSGMPEKAAENTGKAASQITQRANEYGLDISYVGTRFHSESGPKYLDSNTVFETRKKDGRTEFIFNEKLLADPETVKRIAKDAADGIHPKSVNTVAAYADHDFAHLLFYKAKMDEDARFMRWVKFLYRYPPLARKMISIYPVSCTDRDDLSEEQKLALFAQETLAECWASVKNSSSPPKIHKFFAEMLEKRLKRK